MATSKYGTLDIDNVRYENSQVRKLMFGTSEIWNYLWVGLIHYYNFNNTSGTSLEDSVSGSGLTSYNTSIVTGKNEKGQSFNSTSDVIKDGGLVGNFDSDEEFSYSMWVKRDTSQQYSRTIFHGNQSDSYTGYYSFFDNGKMDWTMNGGDGTSIAIVTTNAYSTIGTWYNFVWTYDGSRTAAGTKFYVNGSEITARSVTSNNLSTRSIKHSQAMEFGNLNGRTNQDLDGTMDELAIWDRELSSTEISELYNSGSGKFY